MRITGLQADVQKENKIAERLQICTTGKKYEIETKTWLRHDNDILH